MCVRSQDAACASKIRQICIATTDGTRVMEQRCAAFTCLSLLTFRENDAMVSNDPWPNTCIGKRWPQRVHFDGRAAMPASGNDDETTSCTHGVSADPYLPDCNCVVDFDHLTSDHGIILQL